MFFKGVKNFEASIEIPSRKGDIDRCFYFPYARKR